MSNYSGVENLEVMEDAVKYNRHLASFVTRFVAQERTLMDFGAGGGTFAKIFVDLGYVVHCVEPDVFLRNRLQSLGMNAFPSIEATESHIDAIYSFNVLEHIDEDEQAISSFFRTLSPGGLLILYVPAFEVLYSSMDKKVGHIRRYSKKELVKKVEASGFHIFTSQYVDSLGFFATLLFKLLGNRSGDINISALKFYDKWIFPVSVVADRIMSKFFGKNLLVVARKA